MQTVYAAHDTACQSGQQHAQVTTAFHHLGDTSSYLLPTRMLVLAAHHSNTWTTISITVPSAAVAASTACLGTARSVGSPVLPLCERPHQIAVVQRLHLPQLPLHMATQCTKPGIRGPDAHLCKAMQQLGHARGREAAEHLRGSCPQLRLPLQRRADPVDAMCMDGQSHAQHGSLALKHKPRSGLLRGHDHAFDEILLDCLRQGICYVCGHSKTSEQAPL